MKLLDNFTLDAVYRDKDLTVDSFNFLELSGRKAMYSRGIYGQGVVVAVLDTGVSHHPDLEGRILKGKNFTSTSTSTLDDNCHGTHVAGTIAGTTCGIAPKAEILPLKVLRGDGSGEWSYVIQALDYARMWSSNGKKVKIISMSLSCGEGGITATEKVDLETAINKCVEAGILVVVSSGNTSDGQTRYPASFENVVTVGAVDVDKLIANFSTYGDNTDLCQVGVHVLSCYYKYAEGEFDYLELSGTSMSTPIISGLAALLVCDYQDRFKTEITERKLYEALKMNTKDLGIDGVDKYYGAGFCTLQPLNMTIETEFGSNIVKFNGVAVKVDVPTQIVDGRTLIEMRSFARETGAKISWEAQNEVHMTRAKFEW